MTLGAPDLWKSSKPDRTPGGGTAHHRSSLFFFILAVKFIQASAMLLRGPTPNDQKGAVRTFL